VAEVLAVGTLAYDDVETPFERGVGVLGGAVAYFALAAVLYAPVRIVGPAGDDLRETDLDRLRRRGVDVSGVERLPGRTFRWYGRYREDMSTAETLNTDLGVVADWRPRLPDRLRGASYVFLANLHPEIQLVLVRELRAPRLVVVDSMHGWIERERARLAQVMARSDVVSLNEDEVRRFAGIADPAQAAARILELGPAAVVVKRGARGVGLFRRDGGSSWAPAYPVSAVRDPTGAGDAFAGGFLGHVAAADRTDAGTLRDAAVHGAACASFAVERVGVDGIEAATPEAVAARYRELRPLAADGAQPVGRVGPTAGIG
jgi:sugar/nucleoside kinase (ribokinase family)